MSLQQQWQMAVAWYAEDRRDPNWRRRTAEEVNTVFSAIGLTGEFWQV